MYKSTREKTINLQIHIKVGWRGQHIKMNKKMHKCDWNEKRKKNKVSSDELKKRARKFLENVDEGIVIQHKCKYDSHALELQKVSWCNYKCENNCFTAHRAVK
jgi:hypothetical protein